jgi:hypothetical protein
MEKMAEADDHGAADRLSSTIIERAGSRRSEISARDTTKSKPQNVTKGPNRRSDSKSTAVSKLDTRWEGMFQRLAKYKEMHGDTLVPNRYDADPVLG